MLIAMGGEFYDYGQHWLVYYDNKFLMYDTPQVWDDDWDLIRSDEE
jgi:hypothetical protein